MYIWNAGALFGASIGSNIGAKKAMQDARREEMQRMGIDENTLEMAREVGLLLERSNEGLRAIQDSLSTQQRLARRLDADSNELYEKAKVAMQNGDEDAARHLLMKRTEEQEQLKKILMSCKEERDRMEKMEENVKILERKAVRTR